MSAPGVGRARCVVVLALCGSLALASPAFAWAPVSAQVDAALAVAAAKLAASDAGLPVDAYPHSTNTAGAWTLYGPKFWVSGFLPGSAWMLYESTAGEPWRTAAVRRQAPIAPYSKLTGTNDIGFMLLCSYGNGYRLTGDPAYRDIVLTGANSLSKRYSPAVGMIRSINTNTHEYWVNSDTTMNIELLFRGTAFGGPKALRDQAVSHARRVIRDFIRPDGSTQHLVVYNDETGDVIRKGTIQGYSADSTWSRGQAWVIYGLTSAYRETGDPAFLEAVHATSDYWAANVPVDGVPYWDFDAPGIPDEPRDSSAAAIAASAFLELARIDPDASRRAVYAELGRRTVEVLASDAYLATAAVPDSILLHGTAHAPAGMTDQGTSWGDYYFLEAIRRLRSQVDRLAGSDRYATALRVSQVTFQHADTVVIASGVDYPDAIAASALAGVHDAPVLLTSPGWVPRGLGDEIVRLGATRIIIIGGASAVSRDVETALRTVPGATVERIAGTDRYATAAAVARRVVADDPAVYSGDAFVVRGDDFADALGISPIAYSQHTPVLLTRSGSLPAATESALIDIGASDVRVIGGQAAVSPSVVAALEAISGVVTARTAGLDRYSTAAAVSTWAIGAGKADASHVGIATGLRFPDALAGGAAIGFRGGVLLMSRPGDLSPVTAAFLESQCDTASRVVLLGSDTAVSGRAEWGINQALSR